MIMDRIALILLIIGGVNWGLVGIFKFDLVAYLFGGQTASISRVVYTLVALAALWCISLLFRDRVEARDNGQNCQKRLCLFWQRGTCGKTP